MEENGKMERGLKVALPFFLERARARPVGSLLFINRFPIVSTIGKSFS